MQPNNFPKLHNATWPGIVGKSSDSEPPIPLETMLKMTAAAEVNGVKFDGVDIGLLGPHINIDMNEDGVAKLADMVSSYNLKIGSLVAPVWDGSAMGSAAERKLFVQQVKKACHVGKRLRELGIRPYGIVRIDSACTPHEWSKDPVNNTQLIAQTFREACDVAADYGERLAAEGEICWGGMHSWRAMLETLQAVDRQNIGFQADMSHTLLYLMGYNSPEDRILPENYDWQDRGVLKDALVKLTAALRPWAIDLHVAQNDGTVFGSGSHDKTGRHCLASDPNGKLDVAVDAGFWLREENGQLTKSFRHICWDGCMFPNRVMLEQKTWDDILAVMIRVRELHGWVE